MNASNDETQVLDLHSDVGTEPYKIPSIKVELTNTQVVSSVCAIIDTGCAENIIQKKYAENLELITTYPLGFKNLISASNDKINVLGEVFVKFKIKESYFKIRTLVVEELPHPLILGIPFLVFSRALLDFSNNTGTFTNLENKLVSINFSNNLNLSPLVRRELDLPAFLFNVTVARTQQLKYGNPATLDVEYLNKHTGKVTDLTSHQLSKLVFIPNDKFFREHGLRVLTDNLFDKKFECDLFRRNVTKVFQNTNIGNLALKNLKNPNRSTAHCPLFTMQTNSEISFNIGDNLQVEDREKLSALLKKYRHIFATRVSEMGRTAFVEHVIDTGDAPAVHSRPYRVSPRERQIINEQIEEMLDNGVIEQSTSNWSSPVVLVKKKDQTYRFCVDYRKVNEVTKKDVYPLPVIDDILTYLGGAKLYSTLDLFSGYWQCNVAENSKEKTAFITPDGLYHFNVLPFGLCNAPATFERLADTVLQGLKWKEALVYLDDTIVFSDTFSEHLRRLENVFQRLEQANLTLKPSKCFFGFNKVHLLGHVVSEDGISPDPDKLKAVKEFPRPTSVKSCQSYLGLCNYYRKFIENFSKIARPLYELTKKDQPFIWREEQEKSFQELTSRLVNAPLLKHYDPKRDNQLRVDACGYGIGGVLLQEHPSGWHPVAYVSRSLTKAEKNYSISELEGLAVIYSLGYLRHLIYGKPITIVTDHHALCNLRTLKNCPSGRLQRWAIKLSEYDYEIIHKPGRTHKDADCLSRYPVQTATAEDEYEAEDVPTYLLEATDIAQMQAQDPKIQQVLAALQDPTSAGLSIADRKRAKQFKLKNGILYRVNHNKTGNSDLLVIPAALRKEIMFSHHNEPTSGHLGLAKCFSKLQNRYYWDGMQKDLHKYIKGCPDCQARKGQQTLKPPGFLQPIKVSQPFEKLGIDLLGPFRSTPRQKTFIVVATDYATRWVTAAAIRDGKAKNVAEFLVEFIITKHGAPKYLLSDRGQCFRSELVGELLREMGITPLFTTSYHPQCNGLTERFNKTLADMLSLYTNTRQTDWDLYVHLLVFAYNTCKQKTTGYSPFLLVYGREAVLPTEATLTWKTEFDVKQYLDSTQAAREQAMKNIHEQQKKDKSRYDAKHRELQFSPGDMIKVYTPKRKVGLSDKLLLRWQGPYEIREKRSDVTYLVRMGTRRAPIDDVVHVSRILPYHAPWSDEAEAEQQILLREADDSDSDSD